MFKARKFPWRERLTDNSSEVRKDACIKLASFCDSFADHRQPPDLGAIAPLFKTIVADLNADVRSKALDALIAYLRVADSNASRDAREVCDSLAANCLTDRPETIKKAEEAFLLWVELGASDIFLDAMEKVIKTKKAKALVPAIDIMTEALRAFGAEVLDAKRILTMLRDVFDHRAYKVRASAKGLTIEVCRFIGKDSVLGWVPGNVGEFIEAAGKIDKLSTPTRSLRAEGTRKVAETSYSAGEKTAVESAPRPEPDSDLQAVEATAGPDSVSSGFQVVEEFELLDPADVLFPVGFVEVKRGALPEQELTVALPRLSSCREALYIIEFGSSPEQMIKGMEFIGRELSQVAHEDIDQYLIRNGDALVQQLTLQVTTAFNTGLVRASSRYCKRVLNTLLQVFQIKTLAHSVREGTLHSLITKLLMWLLEKRVPLMDDGSQLLKALNVVTLKIMRNAQRTSVLLVLLRLLRSLESSGLPSIRSEPSPVVEERQFSDLVVKCLVKATEGLGSPISDLHLDLDLLLGSIHEYLQELGRVGKEKRQKAVKDVLFELVILRGTQIKEHLSCVPVDRQPSPLILLLIDVYIQGVLNMQLSEEPWTSSMDEIDWGFWPTDEASSSTDWAHLLLKTKSNRQPLSAKDERLLSVKQARKRNMFRDHRIPGWPKLHEKKGYCWKKCPQCDDGECGTIHYKDGPCWPCARHLPRPDPDELSCGSGHTLRSQYLDVSIASTERGCSADPYHMILRTNFTLRGLPCEVVVVVDFGAGHDWATTEASPVNMWAGSVHYLMWELGALGFKDAAFANVYDKIHETTWDAFERGARGDNMHEPNEDYLNLPFDVVSPVWRVVLMASWGGRVKVAGGWKHHRVEMVGDHKLGPGRAYGVECYGHVVAKFLIREAEVCDKDLFVMIPNNVPLEKVEALVADQSGDVANVASELLKYSKVSWVARFKTGQDAC